MAISKERLEELIKQGAIIYAKNRDIELWSRCKVLENFKVNNYSEPNDYLLVKYVNYAEYFAIEDLFETKEDAEFALEFQNIERVEKLSLPTWEEIQEVKKLKVDSMSFYDFDLYLGNVFYTLDIISIRNYEFNKEIFRESLTKENYLSACSICKQLFLKGEE